MLPVASIGLGLYLIGAIAGGLLLDLPLWVILLLGVPTLLLLWLALTVALIDVTQRPKDQLTDESKIIWLLTLAILNVLAFIPYYVLVIRRNAPEQAASS